jgi:hypothetical protein
MQLPLEAPKNEEVDPLFRCMRHGDRRDFVDRSWLGAQVPRLPHGPFQEEE